MKFAYWIQTELEKDLQKGSSAFVRSLVEENRVVELSVVRGDMTEASLSDPLLAKYPGSFWPAVHTMRQNQASPCNLQGPNSNPDHPNWAKGCH